MRIMASKTIAERLGLTDPIITVLQADVLSANRDRYAYSVEAVIDVTIAFQTRNGPVVLRRKTLATTSISREPGLRARLVRSAALLAALLEDPGQDIRAMPMAA